MSVTETSSSSRQTLQGCHAVVTGGSRGIGLAIAQELLAQGVRTTVLARTSQSLAKAKARLAELGPVHTATVDVSQQDSVQKAIDSATAAFGTVDILINNAGQAVSERFDRLTPEHWEQMLAVNLSGTYYCMQAVLPAMLAQNWGRIVNVASTAGLIGYAYVSAYCAAKHGVIGLTRAVALETAKKGVTVNAVCPGYTDTDIVHKAIVSIQQKTGLSAQDAREHLASRNPQGRLVQPIEVARTVLWLCADQSASINGQAIPVDGGEVMVG